MPKIVDYAGRFEFTRQAAFAVVRDDDVAALSRRRVATELVIAQVLTLATVAAH